MGGGLMQLIAYGEEDRYLTGNPQVTLFKTVYKRHTNFAIDYIEQKIQGSANFNNEITVNISRQADLIKNIYLELVMPAVTGTESPYWTYGVGNALIEKAEINIGGEVIDRHYGEWMNIWTELSIPEGKRAGYDSMVGNFAAEDGQRGGISASSPVELYVPLQFWFCRNPGLALPLIALQYHEVKLTIKFRSLQDLIHGADSGVPSGNLDCKLYVDYIYLDSDERRRFTQASHEYLIEQVQFYGDEIISNDTIQRIPLKFAHPVKEIIWVVRDSVAGSQTAPNGNGNRWFNFNGDESTSNNVTEAFSKAKITFNGRERIPERNASYFRKVQNYEHHTRIPRASGDTTASIDNRLQMIYTYSFAFSPEEHSPSGTCNFGKIDKAVLQLSNIARNGVLKVFAVNYNVLRIMSGMSGLAYSK